MDYNTTGSDERHVAVRIDDTDGYHDPPSSRGTTRSKAGITPMALIVTRNVQKFFANKILQQESKNNSSHPSSNDGTINTSDDPSNQGMDVGAVLHDVDEILDHRSIEDGRLLLRGMVADLLKEIDLLRYKYDTLHTQFMNVKEERDVVNHIYNDKIDTLTMTLQNAIQHSTTKSKNHATASTASTTDASSSSLISNEMKQHMEDGKMVSADVATTWTIQTLMRKCETLHVTTSQQQETIGQLQEQMEDLQCDNDAKSYKIMALEQQFTHINQKRTKVIAKFGTSTTTASAHGKNSTTGSHNHQNTSMILRPLRLNPMLETTTTTPKTSNKDVKVPDEKVVVPKQEDYNSIYQDHKENIIANIFIQNSPMVAVDDSATNPIVPSTGNDDITTAEAERTTVEAAVVPDNEASPPYSQVDPRIVPSLELSTPNVPSIMDDIPDDEIADEKENIVPTVPPKQTTSPFTTLLQSPPPTTTLNHGEPDDEDEEKDHRMMMPPTKTPAMVTPPPLSTKHRSANLMPKTTTILEASSSSSNRIIEPSRHSNVSMDRKNTTKQPSSSLGMGKSKSRHGPRAPRLVQLVEQV